MTRRTNTPEREFRALFTQGLTLRQVADATGTEIDSVRKRAHRLGITKPKGYRKHDTEDAAWTRAAQLIREGMPARWVAEDTGLNIYAIREKLKPGRSSGWSKVWPDIRTNDALLALHREFAPGGSIRP